MIMHVRMNMLAGDPARLDEATRYMEGTVRPHVEGLPGNRGLACLINADRGGVHEGRFTGTHTGPLRGLAAGEIPATGRTVEARFAGVYEFEEGKITSWHLYFDQADMLSQLGLAAGSTPSGMLPARRISNGTVHVSGRLHP